MPHYVNIAWEDYFLVMSFCLQLLARLFDPTLGVGNVPQERGDKKHDKK